MRKKVECLKCGLIWTTELPEQSIDCTRCEGPLKTSKTEHVKRVLSGLKTVWTGRLGGGEYFLLIHDPRNKKVTDETDHTVRIDLRRV